MNSQKKKFNKKKNWNNENFKTNKKHKPELYFDEVANRYFAVQPNSQDLTKLEFKLENPISLFEEDFEEVEEGFKKIPKEIRRFQFSVNNAIYQLKSETNDISNYLNVQEEIQNIWHFQWITNSTKKLVICILTSKNTIIDIGNGLIKLVNGSTNITDFQFISKEQSGIVMLVYKEKIDIFYLNYCEDTNRMETERSEITFDSSFIKSALLNFNQITILSKKGKVLTWEYNAKTRNSQNKQMNNFKIFQRGEWSYKELHSINQRIFLGLEFDGTINIFEIPKSNDEVPKTLKRIPEIPLKSCKLVTNDSFSLILGKSKDSNLVIIKFQYKTTKKEILIHAIQCCFYNHKIINPNNLLFTNFLFEIDSNMILDISNGKTYSDNHSKLSPEIKFSIISNKILIFTQINSKLFYKFL